MVLNLAEGTGTAVRSTVLLLERAVKDTPLEDTRRQKRTFRSSIKAGTKSKRRRQFTGKGSSAAPKEAPASKAAILEGDSQQETTRE